MHQNLRIIPQNEWINKSNVRVCQRPGCGRTFGLLTRSDNCNCCGKVMCAICLERQLTLPGFPGAPPVPLCHACAVQISKIQAEAESAYQQQIEFTQMLNTQKAETERILTQSTSLRYENERLLRVNEELNLDNERLRTRNSVLETFATSVPITSVKTTSEVLSPTKILLSKSSSLSVVNSPYESKDNVVKGDSMNVEQRSLDEQLRKKQIMLDKRESILQEALKKVSSDADRIATQRIQLQEEEKYIRVELSNQFHNIIEEELRRLQDVYLEELEEIREQFETWMKSEITSLEKIKLKNNSNINTTTSTSTNTNNENNNKDSSSSLVLQLENEIIQLKEDHIKNISQLKEDHQEQLVKVENTLLETRNSFAEELSKRKKRFDEDKLVMQNAMKALQNQIVEEKKRSKEAQDNIDNLKVIQQQERQKYEENSIELREKIEEKLKFSFNKDFINGLNVLFSEWKSVSNSLLAQHSASLEIIIVSVNNFCFYLIENHSSNQIKNEKEEDIAAASAVIIDDSASHNNNNNNNNNNNSYGKKKGVSKVDSEDSQSIAKLRRELNSVKHQACDFEIRADEHARQVMELKRNLSVTTEELQKLREKLFRTEKALIRANSIEKRLAQEFQLQKQKLEEQIKINQEKDLHKRDNITDNCKINNNNNNENNNFTVIFVTNIVNHTNSYMDLFARLIGDTLFQHFSTGVEVLQKEWQKRQILTKRNTIALEETTASIKSLQEDLRSREDSLKVRERELRIRRSRLMKVSKALQNIAGRLRIAVIHDQTETTWDINSI